MHRLSQPCPAKEFAFEIVSVTRIVTKLGASVGAKVIIELTLTCRRFPALNLNLALLH